MSLPPDLKARVLASVGAAPPSPPRVSPWKIALWILPVAVAVAVSLFMAMGGFRHGEGRPDWMYVGPLLGWISVAVLATWGAFGRGRSAVGRTKRTLALVAAATPAALFAMMLLYDVAFPEASHWWPGRPGFKCLGLTIAMAAWPLVGMALVRRSSDPVHPGATGAALGAASGAWAGVMVHLWCPVSHPAHLAIGHILPIVLLSVSGFFLGKRVIALRGRDAPP